MKYIYIKFVIVLVALTSMLGCTDLLDKEFYNQHDITAGEGGITEAELDALWYGAYSNYQFNGSGGRNLVYINDFTGDHIYNESGGLSDETSYLVNWSWDSQNPNWFLIDYYQKPYRAIRDLNGILAVIEKSDLSDDDKKKQNAEARFMRAHMYDVMYSMFGPVPLITELSPSTELARADEDVYVSFIQNEIEEVMEDLPINPEKGRVSRGGAYAILMKHYLNQKEWTKTIIYAQKIEDLGKYELFKQGDNPCRDLFKIKNEAIEKESIISFEASSLLGGTASAFMSHSYPNNNYGGTLDGDDVKLNNQSISGTKNRVYSFFYDSFAPGDLRKEQIIKKWKDKNGNVQEQGENKLSPFKYWPDPAMDGWASGHDFRVVRYADVLLSKAEALNEINGPTQEAIDLINEVRDRANAPLLDLGGYTKASLRDAILDERGWEFYFEGHRRIDLIRHGKFVSNKINHPVSPRASAETWRVRFPIPLKELQTNSLLVQNPGY